MTQGDPKIAPPEALMRERAKDGWQYVGAEILTGLRPSINDRSTELPLQMEVDLKKKYGQGDREMQFVISSNEVVFPSDEVFKVGPETGESKLCYVFARTKK